LEKNTIPVIIVSNMERNNLNADEIIHIGDSISNDKMGADNVNIKSIWLYSIDLSLSGKESANSLPDK
jgi:FMN phosphatase YigB (HAD superfamily)